MILLYVLYTELLIVDLFSHADRWRTDRCLPYNGMPIMNALTFKWASGPAYRVILARHDLDT